MQECTSCKQHILKSRNSARQIDARGVTIKHASVEPNLDSKILTSHAADAKLTSLGLLPDRRTALLVKGINCDIRSAGSIAETTILAALLPRCASEGRDAVAGRHHQVLRPLAVAYRRRRGRVAAADC